MRYQVLISYNGTNYAGWQIQPNVVSIQQILQDILALMHRHPVLIVGSGRTDAGVHALAQSFHFDSDMQLTEDVWVKALNSQLPKDMTIREVHIVPDTFHARFSVVSKRYDYLVNTGIYDPLHYNLEHQLNRKLDVEAMRQGASLLKGTHDYASFCANSFEEIPNQIRTVTRIDIEEENDRIRFILEGNGFLRYMVRMLVANLIDVGLHRKTTEDLATILDKRDKTATSSIVPACGLYLVRVDYKEQL
ncbi:MAG: tRNA pseudouridine(38-40) synthase TruA [Erysipelotrichaceae bacterium]